MTEDQNFLKDNMVYSSKFQNSLNGKKFWIVLYVILFVSFVSFFLLFAPTVQDVKSTTLSIGEGSSLRTVSRSLQENNVIRSRVAFETLVIFYGGEKNILPGDYIFPNDSGVFKVARDISLGRRKLDSVKVTIPEGYTDVEIADRFAEKLNLFDRDSFLEIAKGSEGRLFPDTYFFLSTDTEKEVFDYMIENFENKVSPILLGKNIKSEEKINEILVMASIIEKEAIGEIDRNMISGILWKRLEIGMPLQVDVAPDTYNMRGLPASPIANPGLSSVLAALEPISLDYLYYLHGKDGQIHYATNFEDHNKNKFKYLR